MTDKEKLIELAARCEAAEGPDRELDKAISRAVNGGRLPTEPVAFSGRGVVSVVATIIPPNFTASLDAAMTLVPEGWFIILDDLGADGLPLATLHTPERMRKVVGIARNLTLALCAAALKAKGEEE